MDNLKKWEPFKDWDPMRELDEFQNRLSSFFGRNPAPWRGGDLISSEWSPAMDIIEDENEFLIKAELPDVRREDVHVTVDNGVLTIRGERKQEHEEKGKRFHLHERSFGTFLRRFTLPEGADAGKVRAEYRDGILQIHLAKSEKARRQEIEVKVE
jgi:HSP20 family protein